MPSQSCPASPPLLFFTLRSAGGAIDALFGNEDEAAVLCDESHMANDGKYHRRVDDMREALSRMRGLAAHVAVITLGDRGCMASMTADGRVVLEPACIVPNVNDTTGAGDCFCSGFLAGLLREGSRLEQCCRLGNLGGAAAVQGLGAEVSKEAWAWLRAQDGASFK